VGLAFSCPKFLQVRRLSQSIKSVFSLFNALGPQGSGQLRGFGNTPLLKFAKNAY